MIINFLIIIQEKMEKLMQEELLLIEGGKNWWYIVGGSIMVVSGVAGVIVYPGLGGKLAGGGTAISGVATVVDGWDAK